MPNYVGFSVPAGYCGLFGESALTPAPTARIRPSSTLHRSRAVLTWTAGLLYNIVVHSAMKYTVAALKRCGCMLTWTAGTDSSSWHTSMPNTSGADRRTCTFSYRSSECFAPQSRLPGWGGPRAGLSEQQLRAAAERGSLPVTRRRVLGLPDRLPWEPEDGDGTWVDSLGRVRPASEKGKGKHG